MKRESGSEAGRLHEEKALLGEKKKQFFVNILCGESYFGKKSVSIFLQLPTSKLSFEAPSRPFLDRLDTFSDAIDLINTLILLFLPHLRE